jgi:hypothetical protein
MNSLTSGIDRRITALQAQALTNSFLSDRLPDRFTADSPLETLRERAEWIDRQWRVPVILAYPGIGSLGVVGEAYVDNEVGTILSHTSLEQMKQKGMELYATNQDAIKAAFL